MIKVTYNDGGFLLTLFKLFGIGYTTANEKDEKSITISFNIGKAHTFLTLAWI